MTTAAQDRYLAHDRQNHRNANHTHPVGPDTFGIIRVGTNPRNSLYVDPTRQKLFCWTENGQLCLDDVTPDILRHIAEIFVWAAEHAEEIETRKNSVMLETAIEAYNKLTTEQKKLFATRT